MYIDNIRSEKDTHIGILLYIKNNVSIDVEIGKIESGIYTDVAVNKYFQNSVDYQNLQERVTQQKITVEQLSMQEKGSSRHLLESHRFGQLEKALVLFKSNTLRLAEAFLKITNNTQRLLRARECFEKGLIQQADKLLVAEDLINDQDALIVQMEYLQKHRKILERYLDDFMKKP